MKRGDPLDAALWTAGQDALGLLGVPIVGLASYALAGVVGLPGAGIMVVLGWALAVIDLLRTASWLGVTGWASALAGLVILWAGR